MQQRRGIRADLPISLSEGEFGWCLDTRQLFIGNSPGYGGNSEILTEKSNNSEIITNKFKTVSNAIASAVTRPLGAKINDIASVKDFGAKGDGVTDDTAAINSAIEDLLYNEGTVNNSTIINRVFLYFPAGVYLISETLLLYPFVTFIGNGIEKTIIKAQSGYSDPYMAETCDSEGNTAANIGSGTGILPQKIVIQDLTFDTNSQPIDIFNLVRYQSIRFENVKFKGDYVLSDTTGNTHYAVTLQSIGTAIDTYDAQFVKCEFSNVSHALFADDPVYFTTISNCKFSDCYRGINFGETAVSGGPEYSTVQQSVFNDLYGHAIFLDGANPGVSSSSNIFKNVGILGSESPIYFGLTVTVSSSVGDMFDSGNLPGVTDVGSQNLIVDPQQVSIPTQVSLTNIQATTLTINATTRVSITNGTLKVANLTTTARNLLTASNGDIIYNSTDNRFQGYQNGAWINLDNGSPA
jgi:hypothetical protein